MQAVEIRVWDPFSPPQIMGGKAVEIINEPWTQPSLSRERQEKCGHLCCGSLDAAAVRAV